MQKVIDYCFRKQKIASCYFNKEDNSVHLTGIILGYNDDELLLAHITPRGEYDGFVLNKMDNLYRIDYEGKYEKKIYGLYKLKSQTHPNIPCDKEGIAVSLLKFALENEYLVTLELDNTSITGKVDGFGDYVSLQIIDVNGEKDGRCIIDINEIVTFSCDTDYEQDLKTLNLAKE